MRHGGRDLCSGEPPLTPPLNSGAVTDNCKQLRVSNDPPGCGSGSAVPAGPGSHHCESRRPEVCQTPLTVFLPYRPDGLRYDRYAAHKAAYPGGASSGYASEEGSYGLSITKLWGNTNGSYDAVVWALDKGITDGTSDTTFSPNAGCTRAQIVTFLWRAAGFPEPSGKTNLFADVKEDTYYFKALLWAIENGITNGTSATTFSPDMTCTRGQMAAFLYRSANTPAVNGSASFTDVKDSDYFSNAVVWASKEGITDGTSETTFSPDATCTRGQMAAFLYRYLVD